MVGTLFLQKLSISFRFEAKQVPTTFPGMAIKVIVQYNGGFLPDILLLTQALIFVWFDGTIIVYYNYYPLNYVLQCLLFCYVWWLCMAINISVRYHGGIIPDIILSTQGYYHRGTHLNTM